MFILPNYVDLVFHSFIRLYHLQQEKKQVEIHFFLSGRRALLSGEVQSLLLHCNSLDLQSEFLAMRVVINDDTSMMSSLKGHMNAGRAQKADKISFLLKDAPGKCTYHFNTNTIDQTSHTQSLWLCLHLWVLQYSLKIYNAMIKKVTLANNTITIW